MESQKYDYEFKLVMVGEWNVGKTSLLLRFKDDIYNSNINPGFDFYTKVINLQDKNIKLIICDLNGSESSRTVFYKRYYKGANGVILCYDLTNEKSFDELSKWIERTNEFTPPVVPKVLLGNKCDLIDRKICYEQGQNLAKLHNLKFFESSARSNINVSDPFMYLISENIKTIEDRTNSTIKIKEDSENKNKGICSK